MATATTKGLRHGLLYHLRSPGMNRNLLGEERDFALTNGIEAYDGELDLDVDRGVARLRAVREVSQTTGLNAPFRLWLSMLRGEQTSVTTGSSPYVAFLVTERVTKDTAWVMAMRGKPSPFFTEFGKVLLPKSVAKEGLSEPSLIVMRTPVLVLQSRAPVSEDLVLRMREVHVSDGATVNICDEYATGAVRWTSVRHVH